MYALDANAITATLTLIESGDIHHLEPREKVFAYMPLMHAENLPLQRLAVRVFARLARESVGTELEAELANNSKYAVDHADIVERFGRFPHRNEILGRVSTDEELAFLETPGSAF